MPRSALENKVRAYLKESAALGKFCGTSITADMLQAEVDRINRSSRLPQRLRDLFAALGNDSFLIHETFARATLAGRLTRSFFSTDERFHREDGRRKEWDEWWLRAQESLDEAAVEAVASTQVCGGKKLTSSS